MKLLRPIAVLALCVSLAVTSHAALAVTGSVFTIAVPGGETIDREKDHFSVAFEDGWISKEDGWLSRLFSQAKAGLFTISGNVTFDDNQSVKLEHATPLEDPSKSMARSLGFRGVVYPDLPADITQVDLSLRLALTNEDRMAKLLGALDGSKAGLPAEVLSGPWIGYARMVSVVTQSIFGTNDSDYPLTAKYSVSMPSKEHYVIMVASNKDHDDLLTRARATDFAYDNQKLQFKQGAVPADWTYFVLRIKRNPARKSVRDRAVGLDTPWATVIRTQLNALPVSKARTEQQLSSIADNTLTAIQNLGTFLVADRSFSNYDRATGIYFYADESITTLNSACRARKIANCPVEDIAQYRRKMAQTLGLSETKLATAVNAIRLQAAFQSQLTAGKLDTIAAGRYAPLPYLSDWEALLADNPALSGGTKGAESAVAQFKDLVRSLEAKKENRLAWDFVIRKPVAINISTSPGQF